MSQLAVQEILVTGATVIDGSGAPAERRDVLVSGSWVAAVEPEGRLRTSGRAVVEATGLAVTPGFIDVHSHADNAPFLDEDDTSKLLQGVTTEVVGNCGFSLAPRLQGTADLLEAYSRRIFPPMTWRWHSFRELFAAADQRGYVTNYAALAGHHALRLAAMAMADRAPDDAELRLMGSLLDEAVEAGVFGLSTGLIYPPGLFSQTEELVELARRLPPHLLYATHMRGEGTQLPSSLEEAIRIGRESGRRVQVSHLKAAGRRAWGTMGSALDRLDRARADGLDIRHDVYPYTAGSTMLTATLPRRFQEGGEPRLLQRLQDPAALDELRRELAQEGGDWENHIAGAGWDGILVATTASHRNEGRTLAEIAHELGVDPFDALVRVLVEEELRVSMIVFSMQEDDLRRALRDPHTMVGSDGLPPGVGGRPHPRMYGTFPRVLARYVREVGLLSLEEATRRMTSLPADMFGIPDRGLVAPGMAADLVAFDPAAVADQADYHDPVRPPVGLAWVMQGGEVVVRDGAYLGRRAGRRLVPAESAGGR